MIEREAKKVINLIRHYSKNHSDVFVNFSGGRFSLGLLHLAKRALGTVKAIYIDSTISIPESRQYVREITNELGAELIVIKREDLDLWYLVKRWGFPSRRGRWCKREFKMIPLRLFNQSVGGNPLHLTGTTMDGSTARKIVWSIRGKYYFNYFIHSFVLHPILQWNKEIINEYTEKHQLRINPAYSIYGRSVDCYYCPFVPYKEYFRKLVEFHPELFQRIVEAEKSLRKKDAAAFYLGKGKKLYASSLAYDLYSGFREENHSLNKSLKSG